MIMSDVSVNQTYVEDYSDSIDEARNYFESNPLEFTDDKSTISANEKGRNAYQNAQAADILLGDCLTQDAENIRELGRKFEQYDEMLADVAEIESVRRAQIPHL